MNTIKTNHIIQKFGGELIQGSFKAFVFRLLGFLMAYVFTLLIARQMGTSFLGVFILSLIVLDLAGIINSFGFEVLAASFTAEYKSQKKNGYIVQLYVKILQFTIGIGIVLSAAIYLSAGIISELIFNKPELAAILKIMSLAVLPLSIVRLNAQVLRGGKKIILFSIFNYIAVYLVSIVILIILPHAKNYNFSPAYAYTFAAVIGMFISSGFIIREFRNYGNEVEKNSNLQYKELTRKSIPLLISELLIYSKQWGIVLIIGLYLANDLVGVFSVISKLVSMAGLTAIAVNTIALPQIAEQFAARSPEKIQTVLQQTAKLMFIAGVPIIVLLFFISPIIMQFIRQDFNSVGWALLLLCLSQITELISGSAAILLQVVNKQSVFRNIVACETAILFMLGLFLIPMYGLNGAGIVIFISSALKSLILILYSKRKLKLITYYTPANKKNFAFENLNSL